MAMSCTECSAPLAPGVKVCPECGSEVGHFDLADMSDERQGTGRSAPQSGSGGVTLIYLACALLLLIVTAVVVVKSHRHHPAAAAQTGEQAEAMPITVKRLTDDYSSDAVNADETYNGKLLEVSGTFYDTSPSQREPTLISVRLSEDEAATFVQCMFSQDDSGLLAALHKGEQVTIRGTNTGRSLGQHPILHDCHLVSSGSN